MTNEELTEIKLAWARGEVVQYKHFDVWKDWGKGHWLNIRHYSTWRIKPKTIRIGDYDVPEPLREMKQGQVYWIATTSGDVCHSIKNYGDSADVIWLARGLCHATREAAELHTKALLSFTEK